MTNQFFSTLFAKDSAFEDVRIVLSALFAPCFPFLPDPPFGYKNFLYYAFLWQNTICRYKTIINHYI